MEKIGKGRTVQAIRSMQTVTMKGEKYFLALSQVFLNPVLVVASPFSFAFLMPKNRSTPIEMIRAPIQMAMINADLYRCSCKNV